MVPYFSALGYQCEPYDNPADFALDILIDASRTPNILERLSDTYKQSTNHTDVQTPTERGDETDGQEALGNVIEVEAAQTLRAEIFYVSQRTLRNALRNPAMGLAQVTVSIMIGLLVGLVFFDLKKSIDAGAQDRLGAIFFIVVNQVFSSMTAIEPLLQERVLFIHVRSPCDAKRKLTSWLSFRSTPADIIEFRHFSLPSWCVTYSRCAHYPHSCLRSSPTL